MSGFRETGRRRGISIQENVLDKVIRWVAPVAAARRYQARAAMALAGGYVGGSKSRRSLSTFNPQGTSADAALLPDLPALRERSRDLVRNSPIACGAISTVTTCTVGPGLTMNSVIDGKFLGLTDEAAQAWQREAERLFSMWADSQECDTTRTQNFAGLQSLAFRSTLENGDVFSLLPFIERPGSPFGLKVTLVEADRVCNTKGMMDTDVLAGGVELDNFGAPKSYHILRTHPGSIALKAREWDVVPAFGEKTGRRVVLHHFDRLRVGLNRGAPYLSPVIETLKQLSDYSEAELMAAVVSGMFTVFIKSEAGETPLAPMAPTAESGGSTSDEDYKLGNGAIVQMANGDEVTTANPGRPNAAFHPFVIALCEQVGVALELPYELLVKHFTASYSAARAALLEAWRFFKTRRAWLVGSFCQPIYEAFLYEQVARGRLVAPGFLNDEFVRRAYCGAVWTGRPMGHIQPAQEAQAIKTRLETKVTNLQKEIAEYDGGDWEDSLVQSAREKKLCKEYELETAPAPAVPTPANGNPRDPNAPDPENPKDDEPEQD